jgi:DNA-binding MarR family transcriptional regulator
MGAPKNYNYNMRTDITRAMSKHNKIMAGPRFNSLDGNILNLIRSFSESNAKFYMSNKELAEIMIADPSTIQRSIDRLIAVGLVTKEIIYIAAKPQRLLAYQSEAIQKLLEAD